MRGENNALCHRKTVAQKTRTLDSTHEAIVKDVITYGEESVSIAIKEVTPRHWPETVYTPDIVENAE